MAGNMGDMGDMGDTANSGVSLGGSALVWPDRVDLPFAVIPDPDPRLGGARISATRFGHEDPFTRWSTEWKATALLAEFTDSAAWRNRQMPGQTVAQAQAAGGLAMVDWRERLKAAELAADPASTRDVTELVDQEIDALLRAAETERADALGEIVGQHMTFVPHMMALLDATPAGRPATNLLINAAVLIAGFVGQHFKQIYQRRRPAQVCPALHPPIDVPGHAAYPSGHAAQAHLCALSLAEAFGEPPMAGNPPVPLNPAPLAPALDRRVQAGAVPALRALAWRLARNREIAGVHYRSDTEAGREMAEALFQALMAMPGWQALVRAVHAEWH